MANHADLGCEGVAAREALQMLVEVHGLSHVVLIAHAGCSFYLRKLGVSPERCESRQRGDLIAVGRWLHAQLPHVHVSAYYAFRRSRRVELKPVYGGPAPIPEVRRCCLPSPVWNEGPAPEALPWQLTLTAGRG